MCVFCNIDFSKLENTLIYESKYFYVLPSIGALVDGYILIVSKRHVNASVCFNDEEVLEYFSLISKYQKIFLNIYGKMPIVFEHGSFNDMGASSVVHAHTHIVNFNFSDEEEILNKYNFINISFDKILKNTNYVKYINDKEIYVTYNFPSKSQFMRILISNEIGISDKYNWKNDKFMNNVISTIERLKGE